MLTNSYSARMRWSSSRNAHLTNGGKDTCKGGIRRLKASSSLQTTSRSSKLSRFHRDQQPESDKGPSQYPQLPHTLAHARAFPLPKLAPRQQPRHRPVRQGWRQKQRRCARHDRQILRVQRTAMLEDVRSAASRRAQDRVLREEYFKWKKDLFGTVGHEHGLFLGQCVDVIAYCTMHCCAQASLCISFVKCYWAAARDFIFSLLPPPLHHSPHRRRLVESEFRCQDLPDGQPRRPPFSAS